jgi:integrase
MASLRKRNDRWEARVRRTGQPTQTKTFTLKSDATQWARETELALERGFLNSRPQSFSMSLQEAAGRYLNEVTVYHKGGQVERYRLRKLVKILGKAKLLNSILASDIATLKTQRLLEVSTGTVRRELNLLSSLFETAKHEWGGNTLVNPVAAVKRPPDSLPRDRRLTPWEKDRLLSEAKRSGNPTLHTAIVIALETAMRQGEILKLKWSDVDFDKGQIIVRDTKNGSNRMVAMSSSLKAHLIAVLKPDGCLFEITSSGLQQAFKRLVKRLQIHNLRFHDLRHEAISSLFERGLSVPEMQLMSGHKTIDQLMRYSHAQIENIKPKLAKKEEPCNGSTT